LVSAGDYGIVATVKEGAPVCATEGQIDFANTNKGVWVKVGW